MSNDRCSSYAIEVQSIRIELYGFPEDIVNIIDEFLLRYDPKIHTFDYLAKHGKLKGIKWLQRNYKDSICTTNAMNWAAENGHLDVVKWLHENYSEDVRFL